LYSWFDPFIQILLFNLFLGFFTPFISEFTCLTKLKLVLLYELYNVVRLDFTHIAQTVRLNFKLLFVYIAFGSTTICANCSKTSFALVLSKEYSELFMTNFAVFYLTSFLRSWKRIKYGNRHFATQNIIGLYINYTPVTIKRHEI